MSKVTIASVFVLRDPKKHSVRYDPAKEEGDPISSSVYLNKSQLKALASPDGMWPAMVKVEVTVVPVE